MKKPAKDKIDLFPSSPAVVDKEVKGQNSVHATKAQNSNDSGCKVQRSTDSGVAQSQKSSETEAKVQRLTENDARVQRSLENGPTIQKSSESKNPPQQKVKVQTSLENHSAARSLLEKETKVVVQNSLDSVPKGQRIHAGQAEEVEPAASQVIKEAEQGSVVKETERATTTLWTGMSVYT